MTLRPRLTLSQADLDAVRAEAEAAYAQECCGVLVGTRDAGGATVESVIKAANTAVEPKRRFEVDPETLFAAYKSAREAGLEVIGHYHSHPDGTARPSVHDRARALAEGEVWLIVPVKDGGAGAPRAYLFTGKDFEAMEIAAPE